jgi:flagellar hook-length control protein FliK
MQATPIRPATLMMEFMATEQQKIGHGISSLEFSQQLEDQHRKAKDLKQNQASGLVRVETRLSTVLENPQRADAKPRTSREAASRNQDDKDSGSTSSRSTRTLPRKNLPMQEWRASQQLSFNNPAALDKALTDLQLSPTLKEAFKTAQNDKGSISLQKFSAILDRAASGKEPLIADGKASAADVQALVGSLQQSQQGMAEGIEQLRLKESGYYGYDEFRQLIKRIVQQTAKEKLAQDGNGALKNPLQSNSTSAIPVDSALLASNAKLAGQTQNLATNFIPSFLQDEGTKTTAPDQKPPSLDASITSEKSGPRFEPTIQQQPGNEIGLKDATLLPKDGSGSDPFAGDAPDPSALPQTLKGSTLTPNPSGLEWAASNRVNAANTAASPQSTTELSGAQNGTIAPNTGNTPDSSGLKITGAGVASPQEGMASLVNSVEGNGSAVVKSYHFDSETEKSLNNQTVTSAAAGSKAATDSLTAKIAAPTETSGQSTPNKQGQPGLFGFAKEGAQSLPANTPSAGGTLAGGALTEGASWPQALSEGIQELHKQKQNHLTLELESKDLGRILVRVETEQNQVKAVISTESEQARELLQKSSPQLRQQLEAQGLVLSQLQIDLRQHQGERRRANYHDYVSRRARDGASTNAAIGQDGAATLGAATSVHGSGDQIINLFA